MSIDLKTICRNCHQRYGMHFGLKCPEGGKTFVERKETDIYFCKQCGFLQVDQIEGDLFKHGIGERCCICGSEVTDGGEKLKELGNLLLTVFKPYSKARFE